MNNKSFINISQSECLIEYKNILINSNHKWETSKMLAGAKDYGTAISHAIISTEELVKSIVLLLDSNKFQFRNSMPSIFKDHNLRHFISYGMLILNVFSEDLFKFISEARENPQKTYNTLSAFFKDEKSVQLKAKFYLFKKIILLRKEFRWFSKLEKNRQSGFYYDYIEIPLNPISITEQSYFEVILRLEKVRKIGLMAIDILTNQDELFSEQLEQLKKDFKDKKYYENISKLIIKAKQKNKNIFEAFNENQ